MTRQEAEELLPWFVNGTLSREESRAVQAFIDSGEISQQEVEEVRLFAETIQEQSAEEPAFNPGIFEGVMAKLDTVEQEAVDTPVIVPEPHRTLDQAADQAADPATTPQTQDADEPDTQTLAPEDAGAEQGSNDEDETTIPIRYQSFGNSKFCIHAERVHTFLHH